MATARDFTTPEEGWRLVGHFVANGLAAIAGLKERIEVQKNEATKERLQNDLEDAWFKLTGALCTILSRMIKLGQRGHALSMQTLAVMTTRDDLTDPEVREAIKESYRKLKP